MRKEYTPVNLSDQRDIEDLSQQRFSEIQGTEAGATAGVNENGQSILVAIAVPDSIRPPKVSYEDNGEITKTSVTRRICIMVVGLCLTYLTFFESLLLILWGYLNASALELAMGVLWFGATLAVFLGACIGTYKGRWRFLVPGLVLQHFIGVMTRLLVTDLPEPDYAN